MRFPTTLILLLLFNLICVTTYANKSEQQNFYFEPVGDNSDIPSGIITAMIRDQAGFLWLGTQEGIVRFDGYHFKHYAADSLDVDSLDNDNVISLLSTRDGKIWVGTHTNGISILDPKTDKFEHLNKNTTLKLRNPNTWAMVQLANDDVLIATSQGLNLYSDKKNSLIAIQNLPGTRDLLAIQSMVIDRKNPHKVWLGLIDAIWQYDTKTQQVRLIKKMPSAWFIRSLYHHEDNTLWIGSSRKGFAILDLETKELSSPFPVPVRVKDIIKVNKNEFWLAAVGQGIIRVDNAGQLIETIKTSSATGAISSNSPGVFVKDPLGIIWIGNHGGGLNKYVPNNGVFDSYYRDSPDAASFNVKSIIELSKKSLLISIGDRLLVLDTDNSEFNDFYQRYGINERLGKKAKLFKTDDGTLWALDHLGLHELSLTEQRIIHHPLTLKNSGGIVSLLLNSNGTQLWLGTDTGIHSYHLKTKKVTYYPYINEQGIERRYAFDRGIFQDNKGNLWIAATKQLMVLTHNNSQVTLVKTATNAELRDVRAIRADAEGSVWFAANNGLNKIIAWDGENIELASFSIKTRRSHDKYFSNMLFDKKGRIWEATLMFDPKTEELWEFGKADGVDLGADWIGSVTQRANSDMIFGSSNGLMIVKPQLFSPAPFTPKNVISTFWLNGKETTLNAEKHHDLADNESIAFEFSALDYSAPELLAYQYKLEGFNQHWQSTTASNRLASYTNLSPDKYKLWVKSTNRYGDWGQEQLLYTFVIKPRYYQTLWFRTLISTLLLLILYRLYKRRLAKSLYVQQQKNNTLMALERAEAMAELVDAKNQLLADVSHELRTPLTILQLKVEALQHNLVKDVDASYESLMTKIGDINNLISDISHLAQSDIGALQLNFQSNNCQEILIEWTDELAALVKAKGFEWHQDIRIPDKLRSEFDPDKIKQVICNLVNNSLAYTDVPGKITFTAIVSNDQLNITIEDSSPGVNQEDMTRIFERLYRVEKSRSRATGGSGLGLSICKSIVEAHQGEITSSPSHHGGLAISVSLPTTSVLKVA